MGAATESESPPKCPNLCIVREIIMPRKARQDLRPLPEPPENLQETTMYIKRKRNAMYIEWSRRAGRRNLIVEAS